MKELSETVRESIAFIEAHHIDVYSYALSYDTHNRWLSAFIDTRENSAASMQRHRAIFSRLFRQSLANGDYESLTSLSADSGRNRSLGDYQYFNICEHQLPETFVYSPEFIIDAIRLMQSHQEEITRYSLVPDDVIFSCGTERDEYGISWYRVPDRDQEPPLRDGAV